MKKIILLILLLGMAAGIYGWFFIYNKPHTNYEKKAADYTLTAQQLFTRFTENPKTKYTGKVLIISGTAQKTEDNDTLVTVVFVFNEGMFGDEGIRCSFIPHFNSQIRKLKLPAPITLKGFCSGYNGTDVIMEHCSLLQ